MDLFWLGSEINGTESWVVRKEGVGERESPRCDYEADSSVSVSWVGRAAQIEDETFHYYGGCFWDVSFLDADNINMMFLHVVDERLHLLGI